MPATQDGLQYRRTLGQWSAQNHTENINVLEVWAVHLALRQFLPHLRGKKHVWLDNSLTVFHKNCHGV